MLDVALLMANSSQLKTVLYVGDQYRFYTHLIVLLSISIVLQVVVGLLLVFIGNYLKSLLLSFSYTSICSILTFLQFPFRPSNPTPVFCLYSEV